MIFTKTRRKKNISQNMTSSTRSKSKKIASSNNETPNDDPLAAFTPIKQPRSAASRSKPLNRNTQVNNSGDDHIVISY